MGLQLTDTYHSLLKAVPRPPPLTSALPMCYSSPLTDAHKALRPAAAQDVRTSCALFAAKATADEAPKRRACLASLWLAYGMLDECHALVVAESYSGRRRRLRPRAPPPQGRGVRGRVLHDGLGEQQVLVGRPRRSPAL